MDIVKIISEFGFPVVMVVGLGYFVYFVWQTITNKIDPAVQDMKGTIIRLTDQLRLLDQHNHTFDRSAEATRSGYD